MASTRLTDEHESLVCAPMLESRFDDAEPIRTALNHRLEQYRVTLLQLWAGYSLNDNAAALGCNLTIKRWFPVA